ncbi:hypothetical protein Scuro_02 [Acinetobacter phage Scuro]|nr:hypothetical protein Scuro_02 [Acinetobacter phage Scuro]
MTSKITPEHIDELMKRVTVRIHTGETPTPHVMAVAWLDGKFHLATAISKAVDPANFSKELGIQYSTKDALEEAKKKLWELEGYKLYSQT